MRCGLAAERVGAARHCGGCGRVVNHRRIALWGLPSPRISDSTALGGELAWPADFAAVPHGANSGNCVLCRADQLQRVEAAADSLSKRVMMFGICGDEVNMIYLCLVAFGVRFRI